MARKGIAMNKTKISNRIVVVAGPKRGTPTKKTVAPKPIKLGSTCRIVLFKNSDLVGAGQGN